MFEKSTGLTRRQALAGSATAGVAATFAAPALANGSLADGGPTRVSIPQADARIDTPDSAIVAIAPGRVRGYRRNGIYTFKGVPYGAPTGGDARFLPARPVAPWDGVRDTLAFGPVAPHPRRRDWGEQQTQFVYDWDDGYEGEDCLNLNVWSADLDRGAKRPVMVWIHGGGFTSGSSH